MATPEEIIASYRQVQQPYPVALRPQQIGKTGEYLSQRMGWSGFIQPQYPSRFGTLYNGYWDPSYIASRSTSMAYGLATGMQRSSMAPSGGTGPAALTPAVYNQLVSQIANTPSNLQSAQSIWHLGTVQANG